MIETALRDAVEQVLRTDPRLLGVTELLNQAGQPRLYPLSAPNRAKFPYIVFGDDQILDQGLPCGAAFETYVSIRVWARDDEGGPSVTAVQARTLGGYVRAALNARIPIEGYRVVDHRVESTRHMTDPDGLSALALVEFRYWVEASA